MVYFLFDCEYRFLISPVVFQMNPAGEKTGYSEDATLPLIKERRLSKNGAARY